MNYPQLIVISILLVIILILFLRDYNSNSNSISNGEKFIDYEKRRIKYHVFPDFVPEINGKKYYNYIPDRQILENLNRELGTSTNEEIESVNSCGIIPTKFDASIEKENITKNLALYFTDQQEKYNVYEGIKNEINSIALILSNISTTDLNNKETNDVVKFVLMNTVNNYKIDNDSKDIIHVIFLPLVLKDANVIKLLYYDKEICFVGLYTPKDNSKFFTTYPRWYNNGNSITIMKETMFSNSGIILDINSLSDRYSGMNYKCNYLNILCKAGEECKIYNDIMKENIHNMNNQISAYNNYLWSQRNTSGSNSTERNPSCPDLSDPPPSNVNAKFSFL